MKCKLSEFSKYGWIIVEDSRYMPAASQISAGNSEPAWVLPRLLAGMRLVVLLSFDCCILHTSKPSHHFILSLCYLINIIFLTLKQLIFYMNEPAVRFWILFKGIICFLYFFILNENIFSEISNIRFTDNFVNSNNKKRLSKMIT